MTLKNIFLKPVDRPIEGVIKADDEASLRLEIEEYVLTNEVEKRLEEFLDLSYVSQIMLRLQGILSIYPLSRTDQRNSRIVLYVIYPK